jgi:hypothetical protein
MRSNLVANSVKSASCSSVRTACGDEEGIFVALGMTLMPKSSSRCQFITGRIKVNGREEKEVCPVT